MKGKHVIQIALQQYKEKIALRLWTEKRISLVIR